MKVVALAGGVGGAKLADGLAQVLPAENLTVVVNVGDDFDHLGLRICPDLDTVCYTLAGLSNPATGWGRAEETWQVFENLGVLNGPTWFRLGDQDVATHLVRTQKLNSGSPLSEITRSFCRAWGIGHTILPVTDHFVPTIVETADGILPFQEYFVRRQCHPKVRGFKFENINEAVPAPGVLESLQRADLIVICPSNPWVSIDPILAVPGIREVLKNRPVVAVSPIIGGRTIKGPAAKMFLEMGIDPTSFSVANHYNELLSGFVMDHVDGNEEKRVRSLGMRTLVTATIMKSGLDRVQLAKEVISFGKSLRHVAV